MRRSREKGTESGNTARHNAGRTVQRRRCDPFLVSNFPIRYQTLRYLNSATRAPRRAFLQKPYWKSVSPMCHTEHVYHRPCSHWGRERFVGEPCCRARIVDGRYTPCLYAENIGSVNSKEACVDCRFRKSRGGDGWRPFAKVSIAGWARVEEKMQQREVRQAASVRYEEGNCALSLGGSCGSRGDSEGHRWYYHWKGWWSLEMKTASNDGRKRFS
ncbi:hypothetical protein P153DRAFT_384753 [Dothidotthia symphoricarpi CBS 119687]|uniref:Uncharacterized protein n=1 Tax=Dothidotthia symphoricarpi CBS 119687 TaxID=1392245 RepID=A0A6A6AHY5_9PLEO|nr:uncharacterized protein P153DRAFT_384753 [Dothidotthia symphoricarpi CBS 119687]KAF2130484.1 hypothetical protein P153DRAFT_384753 [Dothidotthia symphoricarpi CBS 119687]